MVRSTQALAWFNPQRGYRLALAGLVLSIAFGWASAWALGSGNIVWAFAALSSVSAWVAMAGLGAGLGLPPRKAVGYTAVAYLAIGLVVHLIMLSRLMILIWPAALFGWVGISIGVVPEPP